MNGPRRERLAIWERDRLAAGWLGSAIGAIAAIVLWLVLCWWFSERLPGVWIAVGVLSAVGMSLVYREKDFNAGFGAFNIALLTIFGSSIVIFAFFTPRDPPQRLEYIRRVLTLADANAMLDSQGHHTADARRRNGARVESDAYETIRALSDAELEQRWSAWRAKQPDGARSVWLTSYAHGGPRDEEFVLIPADPPKPGPVGQFFAKMFPPMALLELFGALAIAFFVPLVGLKRALRMVLRV